MQFITTERHQLRTVICILCEINKAKDYTITFLAKTVKLWNTDRGAKYRNFLAFGFWDTVLYILKEYGNKDHFNLCNSDEVVGSL